MKKSLLSIIIVFLVGFLNNSCEFPEFPTPELTISQDFMTHVAVVNFITDTAPEASGALVESLDDTKVTITGPDAARVYTVEGTKNFIITGGKVQLLLDPSADFSGDKEYNINVVVEPKDYLKRIIPVTFTKAENDGYYEVAMLKKTSMPEGITMATNTSGSVTDAGLKADINLTASNAATSGVTTEITVPAGIKMKDASGTVLTGSLKTEVISFSEEGNNTAYFPGGLSPENIDMGNGTTASGAFVSAGFASINMTVGDKKVKTFDGAKVAVKMTLSKDNFNPKTDKPFATDDAIDIWSYDDDNGKWKFESTGIVKKDADNSLYVSFETSHLSYFNLDYLFKGSEGYCPNYYSTIQFNWTSSIPSINCRIVFTSLATDSSSNWWEQLFVSKEALISKGEVFEVYNGPKAATRLDVYDISSGKLLLTKNFAKGALCANPTVTLNATTPQPTVTLAYQAMCPGKNTKVLPPVGTVIYFKEKGSSYSNWRVFYEVSYLNRNLTSLTTNLLNVGKSYDFWVFVGSKDTQKTYTITSANYFIDVPLPSSICNRL
jgi:hypothetical protein